MKNNSTYQTSKIGRISGIDNPERSSGIQVRSSEYRVEGTNSETLGIYYAAALNADAWIVHPKNHLNVYINITPPLSNWIQCKLPRYIYCSSPTHRLLLFLSSIPQMQALTSKIPNADPSWHRRDDHPYYKPSHYRLQRFVREYVNEHIAPNVEEWERTGEIPLSVRLRNQSRKADSKYRIADWHPQAFKRHTSLGFLAASAFPIPKEYVKGITLPGGISVDGMSFCLSQVMGL